MKFTRNNLFPFIIIFVLSLLIIMSSVCPTYVRADDTDIKFDETNVMDDLKDMTFDGKKFSLDDYNFDRKKDTQILSFMEYCYSFDETKQSNYGLYVYIYNPQNLSFVTDSSLNMIQFAITNSSNSSYSKYHMTFLNKSEESDYFGLFYKFKIDLTEEEKTKILSSLNSSSRIYKVSGFELHLSTSNRAEEYPVESSFKYSGYAKGCGPDENAESTLRFTSESLETLTLDVHSTFYRPEGTNGKNEFTQDSLHSVYFAVPNTVIQQYGEMVAVHATWLNAVLKPSIVTGNQDAYNAVINYLGKSIENTQIKFDNLNYFFLGVLDKYYLAGDWSYTYDYSYNLVNSNYKNADTNTITDYMELSNSVKHSPQAGKELSSLYMIFNSGSTANSADTYTVSTNSIFSQLDNSYNKFGGNKINSKYSEYMFESVDSKFTEKNIYADEKRPLTSVKIDKNWWDKLWGLDGTVSDYSSAYNDINAIYKIKDSDLSGTEKQVSDKIFVNSADVDELKNFYNSKKSDSSVYLFRYQVSDYVSQELTTFEEKSLLGVKSWNELDTNSYIFQQTVNLDFDIIDVTFSTGEVETVIPVLSSPIDVVHGGTPPVVTTPDSNFGDKLFGDSSSGSNILKIILGVLLLIFLLWILNATGALKLIGDFLLWLITAPFKLIKKIFSKNKKE